MNPPDNMEYGVWLRSPSVSGGKDWVIFLTKGGLVVRWGKTGHVNQEKSHPFSNMRACDEAFQRKLAGKLDKGYKIVQRLDPDHNDPENRLERRHDEHLPPVEVSSNVMKEWLSDQDNTEWF